MQNVEKREAKGLFTIRPVGDTRCAGIVREKDTQIRLSSSKVDYSPDLLRTGRGRQLSVWLIALLMGYKARYHDHHQGSWNWEMQNDLQE